MMKNYLLDYLSQFLLLTLIFLSFQADYANLSFAPKSNLPDDLSIKYSSLRKADPNVKANINSNLAKTKRISNDPIQFQIRTNKTQASIGEEIELTITAQLITISPNLMFFPPGSNAYTLKMLLPTSFQQTGGDLTEYVTGELVAPSKTIATYTIRGFFTNADNRACFRLLRSHEQATSQSLFVEKAGICININEVSDKGSARVASEAATFIWCIEAELGTGNRSVANSNLASGGQFMGRFGNSTEYMEYTVPDVPAAGSYVLRLWYSSGETPQIGVVVNGNVQIVDGINNGNWAGPFSEKTATVQLQAGTNSLRIQGVEKSFVLDRLCVKGEETACTAPSLTLTSSGCNGSSTYSVGFSAQAGASLSASAGVVQGSQVVNIPVGTNLTLTASLNGCSTQKTANSPSCGSTAGCGTGSGLVGTYYATSDLSQSPALTRTDARLYFNWGSASPIDGVENNFSVRWQGQVEAPVTGSYSFKTYNDDGLRLWVNDQLLINDWRAHSASWQQGSLNLTAGQKYSIRLEYADFSDAAQVQLHWEYPDQPTQLIPSCRLYPTTGCTAPSLTLTSSGCNGSSTYSVGFSAQAGASLSASAGVVQGSQVVNIPVGTNLTLTASLNGCSTQKTANSPSCGSTAGCGTGSGLVGTYYATSDLSQSPALTRTDARLYFNWGSASPIDGVENNFSVRWQGQVEAPVTGSYSFKTYNDDGLRLWVNDQLLINDWRAHSASWQQGSLNLTAGQKYSIRLEYADFSDAAQVQLHWEYPDQPTQLIPSCRLYPTPGCTAPSLTLTSSGCNGSSTYSVGFSAQAGASLSASAGVVQGSQVVNIPVGTNLTLTASLNGCSTQKTANSPSCGLVGGVSGYNYPIPVTPATWPSFNGDILSGKTIGETAVLENAYLKLEVRKNYGGAIQIIDKASGKKLVNFADWGRQNELSIYSGPQDFSVNGWPNFSQIGWNPLTVGDIYGNGAPVVAWGFVRGNDNQQRIYVKTRMINWPTNNTLMDAYNERWYALNGREIDVKARVTFNRSDEKFYEPVVPQEYPCFMRSGKNTLRYYTGNAPYTNAPYTTTNNTEVNGNAFSGGHFMISEPWISQEQNGLHIFVNTDKLALTSHTGYDYQYNSTDYEGAYQATYATPANWLVVDPHDVWYHNYGFYVTNSFTEGREWANSRPRKYGDKPDFRFDKANGRSDWHVGKGYDQGQPFSSDGWNCTLVPSQDGGPLTARRSSICSPFGSWKASTITKLYIRMKYTGQENQFRISFRRNGQSEIPYNPDRPRQFAAWYPNGLENSIGQSFTFTPIKDGQYHTYTIDCGTNPEWRDIIQYFQIGYGNGNNVIPQETISLLYFGVNDPGNQ